MSVVLVGMAVLAPAANAAADLTVDKSAAPVESEAVSSGETITYTVVVTNDAAAVDTATSVTVTDPTPTGTTYVADSATGPGVPATTASNPFDTPFALPNLAPGDSHTVSFQVTVDAGLADGTTITNTATAEATEEPVPATDSTTHTVGSPSLTVTKTATPAADSEVKPGDEITYSVVVENASTATDTAADVKFTDATPANTEYVADSATVDSAAVTGATNPFETEYSLGDLAPGDKKTIAFKVKVKSDAPVGTEITNTAKAKADNHAEVTGTAKHKVKAGAGVTLKVSASADPAPGTKVKAGDVITYSTVVMNDTTSPEAAKTVVYKDPTPVGTKYVDGSSLLDGQPVPDASNPFANGYALGDISPGVSRTLSYKVTVNSGAGAISRTVTVTAANAPAQVTASTTHTGPGGGQLTQRRGSGGSGGSGGGGGGVGAGAVGSVGAGSTEAAGLATTGPEDVPTLAFLAMTLFLAGLTLITRGRAVERRHAIVWDQTRVSTSRLMTRDPSARAWFFSDRR